MLPAAEFWPGFRGQELQGRAVVSSAPMGGTNEADVLWTSSIPGRGYSSPVVSGDSVYVTTAHRTTRFKRFRRVLAGVAVALAAVLGIGCAAGVVSRRVARQLAFLRLRQLALPLLVAVLVAGIAVWSGRLLGIDEAPARAWLNSVAVVLAALVLAGLSLPLRAGSCSAIGWCLIGFVPLALSCHPRPKAVFAIGSAAALVCLGVLTLSLVAGAGLLVMHRVQAVRPIRDGKRAPVGGKPYVLVLTALLLGGIVFAESNCALSRNEMVGTVVSLSLRDGRTLWARETLPCPKRHLPGPNTLATPTAVTDGQRIVAWFGAAGLVCLDTAGGVVWSQPQYLSEPIYGAVSSPVLKDGVLVLVSDLEERGRHRKPVQAWVAGVDVTTGACLWRQRRRVHPEYAGYATPVVERRNGRDVVWVHGWYGLDGYDLRDGKPVGRYAYEFDAAHLVASPVPEGDRLFIPGAKLHRCVDLAKIMDGGESLIWSREATGQISATPVVAGGLIFLVDELGKAMCLSLATGACRWQERLPGRYWSSPVVYGGCVCFLNEKGLATVVAAEPEFTVVARHDLGEPVHASPAAVGNLLVRTDQSIHCIRR